MRPQSTECGDLMDRMHQKHLLCPLHLLPCSPQPSAWGAGKDSPDPNGRASHALIPEGHSGVLQRALPNWPRESAWSFQIKDVLGPLQKILPCPSFKLLSYFLLLS